MPKTFVKTVRLRLREPTVGKRALIEEAMRQSAIVANVAARRMPSLPRKYIKNPTSRGSPLYGIVQDARNNGITLNTACAFEAVHKARESYLAMRRNRNYAGVPVFEKGFVRLHNRDNIGKYFETDGTYYVVLKLFPREKLVLPFAPGDYQEYFLQRIIEKKLDYGTGEVVRCDGFYSLNLSIGKKANINYEPETFIGVDLGLNVIAWAVALDREGNFLGEIHFDGGQAGWIRDRYFRKRKSLQRDRNIRLVKKLKDHESRWMENKNHVVSRRIVEFAKRFKDPIILLEDINGREIRERCGNSRILHSWAHGQLRDFTMYKAHEASVSRDKVPPQYTSQTCPICGHKAEGNRDGTRFKCLKCGYQNHADFVGAWNIAQRGRSALQ